MSQTIASFLRQEDGATAIEYGLIAALIAVGVIGAMTTLGNGLTNLFGSTEQGVGKVVDEAIGKVN
jgi:pilus assembly protein Flp/PilA